jgi:hypothetical protein
MVLIATLRVTSPSNECRYAECYIFIVMLILSSVSLTGDRFPLIVKICGLYYKTFYGRNLFRNIFSRVR